MSKIKDLYYIKDILNNEDGTIHNGETGYYSVDTKPFDSTYGTIYLPKADVNYYYNALKEVFDLEFSPINTYGIVIFADTQVDRIIIYSRSLSSVYLDYNANIGLYWFSTGYSDCYVYDMQTKTLTSYGSVPNNSWWSATINSDWLYTGRYKVLYTADVDYYQMNGMLYSNQNINYLNIESKQGYGSGGWQVPNPNPTRKIVLNGVDYSESITPEPVNIERINYTNTDHSMGGDGTNVTFSDASSNSTADNFFLDLKSYRFSGSQSQVWNSTTSIRTYDGSTKKVWLNWGTQSGSSQQNFDIVEVSDPTRVQVLRDWETITQGGIIEIDILSGANLTADDVILDFKNVYTYESLNGGSWNSITRDIQNNKIVITIPNYFATNSHFDLRVLAVIPRPSHTIKLNGATPLKIMLNGVCYFEKQSGGGYLYNWDLTSSTVDPVSGQSLQYYLNSNNEITADVQTKAGLYTAGTGVTLSDQNDVNGIVLPVNLYTPGNVLEVDFTNFQVTYTMMEWGQTMVETHKCQGSYDTDYGIHWGVGGDYSNWFLTSNYDLGSGNTSYGYCDITNSTQAQLFANSTLKIKVVSSANNRTQWEIYKDDTLLATTPELNNSSTYPFMLASASDTDNLFMLSPNYLNATVTGIRIYQE